jgi:hypothetical protein
MSVDDLYFFANEGMKPHLLYTLHNMWICKVNNNLGELVILETGLSVEGVLELARKSYQTMKELQNSPK